MRFFEDYAAELSRQIGALDASGLAQLAAELRRISGAGRKVMLAGNGGSAAMAAHVAVDFTKSARVRAITFNEADLITCFANDFGYEHWVAKALEYYGDRGDAVILISSSGKSPNMVNAALRAQELGMFLVTFSGFKPDNPLRKAGRLNFWVDSSSYNVVEMAHHIWLLAVVDYLAKDAA